MSLARQERSYGPCLKDDIPRVDQRPAFGRVARFANRPIADIQADQPKGQFLTRMSPWAGLLVDRDSAPALDLIASAWSNEAVAQG